MLGPERETTATVRAPVRDCPDMQRLPIRMWPGDRPPGADVLRSPVNVNAANSTSYTLLPSNLYSLKTTTVTIGAGYRVGSIPVTLNFPLFPATHTYALPLTITQADGLVISGNSGTFMWLFKR